MPRQRTTPESRFWPRVDLSGDCWLWTGGLRGKYGHIDDMSTHRLAYLLVCGPIPDGLCVLHACDVPICVNPGHLFLGTKGDNNRDRARKGRSATGDMSGLRLHPDRVARGDRNGMRVHPEAVQRGERHKLARLTLESVREIKRRYRDGGVSQPDLAREYGVSQATIWKVLHRKAWPHA